MDPLSEKGTARSHDVVAFETLLWELSVRFIDLPGDQVDDAIRDAQRRVCETLGLDRSSLWQVIPGDETDLFLTHVYHRQPLDVPVDERTGIAVDGRQRVFPLLHTETYPAETGAKATYPWFTKCLLAGRTVAVRSPDDLPPEAEVDARTLRRISTASTVLVPMKTEAGVLGCVSFASTRDRREWTDAVVRRFELVAQVFARALNAKRSARVEREHEARLATAAASANAGLWEYEIGTGRVRANEVVRRLLGLPDGEDLTTDKILALVHPEDRAQYRERLAWFLHHDESYSQEYRLLLPDGTIRWINSMGRPFKTQPGQPADRVFGASIDVTDRKRKETALRDSEEINRATFEQAAVGIAHVRVDGSWLRVNDKLCDILGYTRAELVGGMTFQDLTYHDDLASDLEFVREMLAGRRMTYSMEKRYVRRNRSVIWVNLTVSLVRDDAGQPRHFISIVEEITDRKRTEEQLRVALADLQAARDQLHQDNVSLRDEVQRRGATSLVVGSSAAIRAALSLADQVAPTGSTVLLLGETGTGKERFATYIHEHSPRHARTMVRVNCAAIPSTLIESELFGREKGAYTGALSRQIGRFELANGSTIFLDEIGDLPLEVQVKLLRVIDERRLERLGNPRPVEVDVRIVAATHHDLKVLVRDGRFREDLYYRLNVFPISLPPLRERPEDIPLLARALADELSKTNGRRFETLSQASIHGLLSYSWPGNIRELRNLIERAMITCTPPRLTIAVPSTMAAVQDDLAGATLKDIERAHVLDVLSRTGWRIRGPHGAAAVLGLPPTTLENLMKRLRIARPRAGTE
jgi:formate hydrogenlyase transcriptional activator